MARIRLPVLGVGQDPDSLAAAPPPWSSWQARVHAAVQSERAYRADLRRAQHLSFTNFCQVFLSECDRQWDFVCGLHRWGRAGDPTVSERIRAAAGSRKGR